MRDRPLGRRDGRARTTPSSGRRLPRCSPTAAAAVGRARAAGAKSQRELDYITAIEVFYKDHDKVDHRTRAVAYEKAMEQLSARYPDDREAAIFYALALNATALATDKTYAQQLKAAGILEAVFREQPNHPGAAHYLIHSYDYPAIAEKGLGAARRYADHRPGGAACPAHALPHLHPARLLAGFHHLEPRLGRGRRQRLRPLPRLGLPGLRATSSSVRTRRPGRVLDQILAVEKPNVVNFATAFALAAIPSRYALERGQWAEATSSLALRPGGLPVGALPAVRGASSSSRAASAPPGAAISPRPGTTRRGSQRCATDCWPRRSATGPTRWTSSGCWWRD